MEKVMGTTIMGYILRTTRVHPPFLANQESRGPSNLARKSGRIQGLFASRAAGSSSRLEFKRAAVVFLKPGHKYCPSISY